MNGTRVWNWGLSGCAFALLAVAVSVPHARGEVVETSSADYASLSGFVYNDINNSGTYDIGEDRIRDVLITLGRLTDVSDPSDPASYSQEAQTRTDSQGIYRFDEVQLAATYALTEETPYMFVEGKANAPGTFGGEAGPMGGEDDGFGQGDPNRFVQIAVPPGFRGGGYDVEGTGYNFGEWGLKTQYLSKRSLIVVVPEPSTMMLMAGVFLLGLFWHRRR